jgi:hypothetical protein
MEVGGSSDRLLSSLVNAFDLSSCKGGTCWWKWCGDGDTWGLEWAGALFDSTLERGGILLSEMLPTRFREGFWVK